MELVLGESIREPIAIKVNEASLGIAIDVVVEQFLIALESICRLPLTCGLPLAAVIGADDLENIFLAGM